LRTDLRNKEQDLQSTQDALKTAKKNLSKLGSFYNDALQTVQTAFLHIQQIQHSFQQQQQGLQPATVANTSTISEQLQNLLSNLKSMDSAIEPSSTKGVTTGVPAAQPVPSSPCILDVSFVQCSSFLSLATTASLQSFPANWSTKSYSNFASPQQVMLHSYNICHLWMLLWQEPNHETLQQGSAASTSPLPPTDAPKPEMVSVAVQTDKNKVLLAAGRSSTHSCC
jgi:hypothetical protein